MQTGQRWSARCTADYTAGHAVGYTAGHAVGYTAGLGSLTVDFS